MFIFDPELPPTSYRQSLILARRIGLPVPDDSLCMGNFMFLPGIITREVKDHHTTQAHRLAPHARPPPRKATPTMAPTKLTTKSSAVVVVEVSTRDHLEVAEAVVDMAIINQKIQCYLYSILVEEFSFI